MARIQVCPKCKSVEIERANPVSGWLTPDEWLCRKCGYMGFVVYAIDTEDKA